MLSFFQGLKDDIFSINYFDIFLIPISDFGSQCNHLTEMGQ